MQHQRETNAMQIQAKQTQCTNDTTQITQALQTLHRGIALQTQTQRESKQSKANATATGTNREAKQSNQSKTKQ